MKLQADDTLSDFMDKFNRLNVIQSFDSNNKNLDMRKQKTLIRISAEEARYRRQFNELDNLLSSLRSTNNFLTQHLTKLSLQLSSTD